MASNLTVRPARQELNYTTDEEFFHRFCAGIIGLLVIFSLFTNAITVQVFLSRRFDEPTVSRYLYANISFSDLVFLISCVFILVLELIECNGICYFIAGISLAVSASVSSYTMAMIAINRYCACAFPLKHHFQSKDENYIRRWIAGIVLVWILSLVASLFFMRYGEVDRPCASSSSLLVRQCINYRYILAAQEDYPYFYLIGIVTVPLTIGLLFSLMAIRALQRNVSPDERNMERDRKLKFRSNIRIIAVIVAFAISWIPSCILHLYEIGKVDLIEACNLYYNAHSIFSILLMADFLINPIIYCYMNPDFRKALKIILFGHVSKIKGTVVTRDKPKVVSTEGNALP